MFSQLSLRRKLQLLSGLAIAAIVTIVAAGVFSLGSGVRSINDIGQQRLPAVSAIQSLKSTQIALRSSTFEAGLWENDSDAHDQFVAILREKKRLWQTAEQARAAYSALPRQSAEEEVWQRFSEQWQNWQRIDQQINALLEQLARPHSPEQQAELFLRYFQLGGEQRQPFAAAAGLLDELVQLNSAAASRETAAAEQATRIARQALVVAGIVAALLLGSLSFLITRSILREMGGDPSLAASITRAVAAGNLSVHIPLAPGDQSSLLASMHYMQRNLRELIGQILRSADRLAATSGQLTADMQRVAGSGAAEGELANTTAAAVEEISARISAIEAAAQTAQSLSQRAETVATGGQQVVNEAAEDMQRIADAVAQTAEQVLKLGNQSQEISTVVNVIKEVADQTNLLALNAAIEAARAGEQGRGFAVVADEVRKLAERTAGSTQEIAARITSIQQGVQQAVSSMGSGGEQVERGVAKMGSATGAMGEIQSGARDAGLAVVSITESLRDSSGRLQSITRSMADIVQLVSNNGESVEAMATSVAGIEQLAQELEQAARAFQLEPEHV